jgi:hypothetical protein
VDLHHLLVASLLIRISPACRPPSGDRRKPLRHVTSAAAADFPHRRSSTVGSQHCKRLQLPLREAPLAPAAAGCRHLVAGSPGQSSRLPDARSRSSWSAATPVTTSASRCGACSGQTARSMTAALRPRHFVNVRSAVVFHFIATFFGRPQIIRTTTARSKGCCIRECAHGRAITKCAAPRSSERRRRGLAIYPVSRRLVRRLPNELSQNFPGEVSPS